jgi:hypothetical protein
VGVNVTVAVRVGVNVIVEVKVGVNVLVGVAEGVLENRGVRVKVTVAVGVGSELSRMTLFTRMNKLTSNVVITTSRKIDSPRRNFGEDLSSINLFDLL